MGCWQEWCAVSNMHIADGTPVILVVVHDMFDHEYERRGPYELSSRISSYFSNVEFEKKIFDIVSKHNPEAVMNKTKSHITFIEGTYNDYGWIYEMERTDFPAQDWVFFIRKDAWEYTVAKYLARLEKSAKDSEYPYYAERIQKQLDKYNQSSPEDKQLIELDMIATFCFRVGNGMVKNGFLLGQHFERDTESFYMEKHELQNMIIKKFKEAYEEEDDDTE